MNRSLGVWCQAAGVGAHPGFLRPQLEPFAARRLPCRLAAPLSGTKSAAVTGDVGRDVSGGETDRGQPVGDDETGRGARR